MASFNKIMLIGNLTRDPQLSYTPNQTPVVDFGIATNRKWKAQDGSQREDVCFVDCRAFGKTADTLHKYLFKGSPVFVEGMLQFDSWTSQDGTKRSKHRVSVQAFQFLPDGRQGNRQASPESLPDGHYGRGQGQAPGAGPSVPDDDIPF